MIDKIISIMDNITTTTTHQPSFITQNINIKPFVTKDCMFT